MNISTSSWHYKLIEFLGWDQKTSLCLYFWQVIGAIIFSFISVWVAIIVFAFLLSIPGAMLAISYFDDSIWFYFMWTVPSILFWITLFSCLFRVCNKRWPLQDESIGLERMNNTEPKKPNLFFDYIKAKKEKICPVLTFKE